MPSVEQMTTSMVPPSENCTTHSAQMHNPDMAVLWSSKLVETPTILHSVTTQKTTTYTDYSGRKVRNVLHYTPEFEEG
jgi:hypothetical protein